MEIIIRNYSIFCRVLLDSIVTMSVRRKLLRPKSLFWAFRAEWRSDLSYCPCPTTILPLPTRMRLMLPCIRLCFYTFLSETLDRYANWVGVQPRKQKQVTYGGHISPKSQPILKIYMRFGIAIEFPTIWDFERVRSFICLEVMVKNVLCVAFQKSTKFLLFLVYVWAGVWIAFWQKL